MRFLFLMLALPLAASAQQPFTEGVLRYGVYLSPANGTESLGQYAGSFTVTVKGPMVRRELTLNSGFNNATILDRTTGEGYSLQSTPGQKFALALSAAQLQAREQPYAGFTLKEGGAGKPVASMPCREAVATYPNGTSASLCYSTEWTAATHGLFDRFPTIGAIPLRFEYRSDEGALLRFVAEAVTPGPVEAAQFRVPADYKIVKSE